MKRRENEREDIMEHEVFYPAVFEAEENGSYSVFFLMLLAVTLVLIICKKHMIWHLMLLELC